MCIWLQLFKLNLSHACRFLYAFGVKNINYPAAAEYLAAFIIVFFHLLYSRLLSVLVCMRPSISWPV